ncbi:hypothetical protein SKAU_G00145500 [Synaphobranchus kaupii]|uniref:Uncharacterized protein n=1 Tax=Synaphobranchus kaupii TaxID=118154 RepID=A0A9Q1J3Q3_SYNKA|nr:hypothetical protein SKAU_G00145500 [Synaphobranchus kaupii]
MAAGGPILNDVCGAGGVPARLREGVRYAAHPLGFLSSRSVPRSGGWRGPSGVPGSAFCQTRLDCTAHQRPASEHCRSGNGFPQL